MLRATERAHVRSRAPARESYLPSVESTTSHTPTNASLTAREFIYHNKQLHANESLNNMSLNNYMSYCYLVFERVNVSLMLVVVSQILYKPMSH